MQGVALFRPGWGESDFYWLDTHGGALWACRGLWALAAAAAIPPPVHSPVFVVFVFFVTSCFVAPDAGATPAVR